MLSTTQALQEWDNVRKVLNEFRSHAAARPHDKALPKDLTDRMDSSFVLLAKGLVSPVATWKQLLKQKLPYLVVMACNLARS